MKKFNPDIVLLFQKHGIGDEGYLYLLAIYYNFSINCIPMDIQKKVNLLMITQREFTTDSNNYIVKWNIPLFEGEEVVLDEWEWVEEWRALFKKVNPERNGTKQYCITRMKKFFSRHPKYRQDDVMNATKAYLATVNHPDYVKQAHRFIFEDSGSSEYSLLLEWCERTEKSKPNSTYKKMGG